MRLLGSIDSMSSPSEKATDLRGAFDVPIKELKDLEQAFTYKKE